MDNNDNYTLIPLSPEYFNWILNTIIDIKQSFMTISVFVSVYVRVIAAEFSD